LGETLRSLEDLWGIGEEAAVPEVGAAAFEDVDEVGGWGEGRGSGGGWSGVGAGALEVEGQRAAGFVFAVDTDEVVRVDLQGDGFG
jgi:hypothetical protein